MPIFDQGYQHWNGRLAGFAWRWLAITRQGVRQQMRRRHVKQVVFTAFMPAIMLATFLMAWGLLEQKSAVLEPFMALLNFLPDEIRSGPKPYRSAVWAYAFDIFFWVETFNAMLLVLFVGPDLVSQDLRFNAVPLYLSRPIRRFDYFLGKLGVIAVFLVGVAIAPAVAAYALGIAFSLDPTVLADTWPTLLGSVTYGLIVVVSAGSLMLAISSLSRSSRLVGATWIGLWVVSNFSAAVLEKTVRRDWCPLLSYTTNLDRLREELLNVPAARKKFLDLWESGQAAARDAIRPRFPFGRRPGRPLRSQPSWWIETPEYARAPWLWSAGVLGALFVLSAGTLSTRVKSLDRLR